MPSGSRARKSVLLRLVPDAEREHPAQRVHHLPPAVRVEMQQHLGVALRSEDEALAFQLAAQLAIVVDLAVERDAIAPVGARHRLRAGLRQVDDREAPMREADAAVLRYPHSRAVRTAARHVLADAEELLPVDGWRRIAVGVDAGDPAHATKRGSRPAPSMRLEVADGLLQPGVELHLRLPAEMLPRERDVRLPLRGIVGGQRPSSRSSSATR